MSSARNSALIDRFRMSIGNAIGFRLQQGKSVQKFRLSFPVEKFSTIRYTVGFFASSLKFACQIQMQSYFTYNIITSMIFRGM
jgi:hypothetical protein